MNRELDELFGDIAAALDDQGLRSEIRKPCKLILNTAQDNAGRIDVTWAPFDHVNTKASVAIVGITPGRQQMENALASYCASRRSGEDHEAAERIAKPHASFSGDMRQHLTDMLDHIGLNAWLGIESTASLWDADTDMAHFTSSVRWPVFINDGNYDGRKPRMLKTPILLELVETVLAPEMASLPDHCVFVPLGQPVEDALRHAASLAHISQDRILGGLPHPSPGNRGVIYPFLERPPCPRQNQAHPGIDRPAPGSFARSHQGLAGPPA